MLRHIRLVVHIFFFTFSALPAVDNDWAGATSVAFIHLSDQQREKKDKQRKHNKVLNWIFSFVYTVPSVMGSL